MRELYRRAERGENVDVPESADPFFENPDADVRIGTARLYLQPLTYLVRVRENLEIVNFRGEPVGLVEVGSVAVPPHSEFRRSTSHLTFTNHRALHGIFQTELVPCNEYGDEYTDEDNVFIDNPSELYGKNLSFLVKIHCCKNLPKGYTVCRNLNSPRFLPKPVASILKSFLFIVNTHQCRLDWTLYVLFAQHVYVIWKLPRDFSDVPISYHFALNVSIAF